MRSVGRTMEAYGVSPAQEKTAGAEDISTLAQQLKDMNMGKLTDAPQAHSAPPSHSTTVKKDDQANGDAPYRSLPEEQAKGPKEPKGPDRPGLPEEQAKGPKEPKGPDRPGPGGGRGGGRGGR